LSESLEKRQNRRKITPWCQGHWEVAIPGYQVHRGVIFAGVQDKGELGLLVSWILGVIFLTVYCFFSNIKPLFIAFKATINQKKVWI